MSSLLRNAAAVIVCLNFSKLPPTLASQFNTSEFSALFADDIGVLQSLRHEGFDFSPYDYYQYRDGPGQFHTGDLTLRIRPEGSSDWIDGDTATSRDYDLEVDTADEAQHYSSLAPALPIVAEYLNVSRTWSQQNGDITLSFTLENIHDAAVEIGSLGMPIEMNNIFVNRTAVETTETCVLVDPYIGLHAGYLQVTRLTGTGPHLVITPLGDETKLEAWRFLDEPTDTELGYQIQTFEGNYEYQVFTKAYAENEWKGVQPWNEPTSKMLESGQSITIGLRSSIANSVDQIEETVASKDIPVALGIPGYVLPHDLDARLFLNTPWPVASIESAPAGSILVQHQEPMGDWLSMTVRSSNDSFGRARLDISFDNEKTMTIHYRISKPGPQALEDLGTFLTTTQWYTNESDPFNRAPSVISWDRSIDDYVLQDNRTWIAGLSDEGGAGSFLAAGMKQVFQPSAAEIAKLEDFVHQTVWDDLQINEEGETQYGVRKALFYYEPELVPGYEYSSYWNWSGGITWDREAAYLLNRAYDYVHVANLYYSLFKAGDTFPGILTQQTPEWYLLQSYETTLFTFTNYTNNTVHTYYRELGLMGETIWLNLLDDLYATNHTPEANTLESIFRDRQEEWSNSPNPFGSEMAWDSTGEEGVYYWSAYFNDTATVNATLNAIRGYMPTIPHWGWNGNARRYWDFLYAGKMARIERQIHHYGSGLNALPLLSNYRTLHDASSLEAIYDLRVGYGGIQGPMSSIHEDGFASMAFHSYPDTLAWDPYTGDYGPNFVGLALGDATYLVEHPVFGWVSFGGNVVVADCSASYGSGCETVTVEPRDFIRQRVFVAAVGLYVTINAGTIEAVGYNTCTHAVEVRIKGPTGVWGQGRDGGHEVAVRMSYEQSVQENGLEVGLADPLDSDAMGYVVDVECGGTTAIRFGCR